MRRFSRWLPLTTGLWFLAVCELLSADSLNLETLDNYLSQSESQYELTPGTDKKVVWASEQKIKTPFSFVYLHGFSATRQELEPIPTWLSQTFGANLFYNRLSGHGMDGKAMAEATSDQWKGNIRAAVDIGRSLGEKVVIFSASTGSTLAVLEVARDSSDIAGVLMMSPNLEVAKKRIYWLRWPMFLTFTKWWFGDERSFEPANDLQAKYWTHSYPYEAFFPMLDVLDELDDIDPAQLKVPLMVIYSPRDTIVDLDAINAFYARYGADHKQLVVFEKDAGGANHTLAGDVVSPATNCDVFLIMRDFIRSLGADIVSEARHADDC
ncbi:MAG: alpha/beta hydrolase [bacterium]